MKQSESLYLHEEVLLLALRDDEGTIAGGTWWRMAVGGAALAELLLAGRIRIDDSRRRKLVELVSPEPLGEPFLDECLTRIAGAKRRAAASTWVSRLATSKKVRDRIAAGLCRRGILHEDEDQVLLLFKRRIFPERDPRFERAVIERLDRAIFGEAADLDPRTVVLVSIANQTGLLRANFDKRELKRRKERILAIVEGEACAEAAKEAIAAMQAAVIVCCVVVPTVTT